MFHKIMSAIQILDNKINDIKLNTHDIQYDISEH